MCPACITTAALIVAGGSSAGGLAAFAVKKLRKNNAQTIQNKRGIIMKKGQHIFNPLIGVWRTSGQIRATDTSPAVKLTGTDTYEWLIEKSLVLHRVDVKLGEDDIRSVEIIGPNINSNDYFMHSYTADGKLEVTKANSKDGVYVFEGETMRFTGGFSEDKRVFSGTWEQLQDGNYEPWMDIKLEKDEL